MRYFYDTEFIEDGETIELISIGIVSEEGREFYAVSTDFDATRANPWVRENVLDKLPSPNQHEWLSNEQIRDQLVDFLLYDDGNRVDNVELWAWVGAYDHVVFAQLFGDMAALPKSFPRYTRELKQYWEFAGRPALPRIPKGNHDALVDARHNLQKFRVIQRVLPLGKNNRILR